jgi:hypothetical protein
MINYFHVELLNHLQHVINLPVPHLGETGPILDSRDFSLISPDTLRLKLYFTWSYMVRNMGQMEVNNAEDVYDWVFSILGNYGK